MGECSYTMCKNCWDESDDYEIQTTNVPCGTSTGITCTEEVLVRVGGVSALLQRDHIVLVDGDVVDVFPFISDGMTIDKPSTLQTMVKYYRTNLCHF